MTGTSFDALDVAAAEITLRGDALVVVPSGFCSFPMPAVLRADIAALLPPGRCEIGDVCRVDADLGRAAGAAVRRAVKRLAADRAPDCVVWSGQTVHHWVERGEVHGTLQIGRSAFIAEATGLPVVSDLRARDVACGGQGAPLVALVDVLLLTGLLAEEDGPVGALNLGGIGNVTVVGADLPPLAYDVGPANALIDVAATLAGAGRCGYDRDGALADAGTSHPVLMDRLLDDDYLSRRPPKTTGKEQYHEGFLAEACAGLEVSAVDVVATVTEHAAEVAAREIRSAGVTRLLVSGGGVRNPALMRALRRRLPNVALSSFDAVGVPAQHKEALAFAVLGFLSWHGLPGNVPACTGASRAAVLGTVTPGRHPLAMPEPTAAGPRRLVVVRPQG